jgi:hypothetical protein
MFWVGDLMLILFKTMSLGGRSLLALFSRPSCLRCLHRVTESVQGHLLQVLPWQLLGEPILIESYNCILRSTGLALLTENCNMRRRSHQVIGGISAIAREWHLVLVQETVNATARSPFARTITFLILFPFSSSALDESGRSMYSIDQTHQA